MVINDIEINGLREICGVRRIERLIEEKLFSYISKNPVKLNAEGAAKIASQVMNEGENFFKNYRELTIDYAQQESKSEQRIMTFVVKWGHK